MMRRACGATGTVRVRCSSVISRRKSRSPTVGRSAAVGAASRLCRSGWVSCRRPAIWYDNGMGSSGSSSSDERPLTESRVRM